MFTVRHGEDPDITGQGVHKVTVYDEKGMFTTYIDDIPYGQKIEVEFHDDMDTAQVYYTLEGSHLSSRFLTKDQMGISLYIHPIFEGDCSMVGSICLKYLRENNGEWKRIIENHITIEN